MDKKLTHIVGTFLIKAEGAFLNGSTSEKHEGYDITTPKTKQEFNNKIPYVSAQAWRHWLRETYKEEYPCIRDVLFSFVQVLVLEQRWCHNLQHQDERTMHHSYPLLFLQTLLSSSLMNTFFLPNSFHPTC